MYKHISFKVNIGETEKEKKKNMNRNIKKTLN